MRNVLRTGAMLVFMTQLAACGGGGGGGGAVPGGGGGGATATPAPTATPGPRGVPYVLPSANPVSPSAFSVDSRPQGLAIAVDGAAAGTTPATPPLGFARASHVVTIVPAGGAAPYSVTVAQTGNGPHAIFYNQLLDTAGKIASLTPASTRRAAARQRLPDVRRMPERIASRPAVDARRLYVTYDPSALRAQTSFDALERGSGAGSGRTVAQSARAVRRVVSVANGHVLDDVRRRLAAESGVVAVEPVRLRYPLASAPVYPNDTHFNPSEQWDFYQIGAPAAWGYGLGSPAVAIAIIDTGYDPLQPDVAPRVTVAERIVGGTIDASAGAATDTDGHGTFLSAVASAVTNNGAGWAGLAYGASLQEYKVFPDGLNTAADSADVAAAIREAVAKNAKVILVALGGTADTGADPFERDAVAFALASGVTVIAPSGNDRAAAIDFPAAYDGVISVGASALDDRAFPGSANGAREYVAAYSNAGPNLSLVAPGGDPSSAGDTDQIHWIANAYTTRPFAGLPACSTGTAAANCGALFSGTSAAAAHVAGAAGLLLAQHPAFTPAQLAAVLSSTADDIADPNQGSGRLNVRKASAVATGDAAPFPKYVPGFDQFVAFAYTNAGQGAVRPTIADISFPRGVPVAANGTFRIADQPASIAAYRIAVWFDANGNGLVDAGDYIGVTAPCGTTGPCPGAGAIAVAPVTAGYVLP